MTEEGDPRGYFTRFSCAPLRAPHLQPQYALPRGSLTPRFLDATCRSFGQLLFTPLRLHIFMGLAWLAKDCLLVPWLVIIGILQLHKEG